MRAIIRNPQHHLVRPSLGSGLSMFRDLDQMMNEFFNHDFTGRCTAEKCWAPRVDVREESDSFVVSADLPGLEKSDISITVEDDTLTIAGERKFESSNEDGDQIRRRERLMGKFSRSMSFPDEISSEGIKASFQNGVLTINVPKTEPTKPQQIEID